MRRYATSRPMIPMPSLVSTPLVVGITPVGLPNSWIPPGASGAWLACDSFFGGVKYAFDTNVGTLWGLELRPGDILEIRDSPQMISSVRFVRVTATDGHITFIPFAEP